MERTYSQIDMDERRKIARWRMAGVSVDVIAEKLGRHRSTIFRELRCNCFENPEIRELSRYYGPGCRRALEGTGGRSCAS